MIIHVVGRITKMLLKGFNIVFDIINLIRTCLIIADIVHRDIKLENILLSENPADKDDRLFVKVRLFGV